MSDQYEHDYAVKEANKIAAEDAYFAARPQVDLFSQRRCYEAGFYKAWEQQAERIRALEAQFAEEERICNKTADESVQLAALCEKLREALYKLRESSDDSDDCQYGTLSTSFVRDIAHEALALPNIAAPILAERDAKTLEEAADVCENMSLYAGQDCANRLNAMAQELRSKT